MKLRIEQSGLHYYDRKTGLHFLVDEIVPPVNLYSIAPRTFSIAITNECNINCSFCHIAKGKDYLSKDYIVDFCEKIDKLGCFDIAIGGGEPLLHPEIVDVCKDVWNRTSLGISITTNGQLLTESLIDELAGCISFIRISVDSVDAKIYQEIRRFDFHKLKQRLMKIRNKIPFGLNVVVDKQRLPELDKMLKFAQTVGAEELLLLPLIEKGQISLTANDLNKLEAWIIENYKEFPIRILEQARKEMRIPVLFNTDSYYSDYLYLSAEKLLKSNSYEHSNFQKLEIDNIENVLISWRKSQMGDNLVNM